MAISITQICNASLLKIGAKPISDYDSKEDTNAEHCRFYWPIVSDAILRAHEWNCASSRAKLTQYENTPTFGYNYSYALPTKPYCLRVLRMVDPNTDGCLDAVSYPWRVEGRHFLCNESTAYIRFIKRITDPNEFDSLLVQVLIYSLAAELSPVIKQNKQLPEDIVNFLTKIWKPLAYSIDAQEGSVRQMQGKTLLRSRII